MAGSSDCALQVISDTVVPSATATCMRMNTLVFIFCGRVVRVVYPTVFYREIPVPQHDTCRTCWREQLRAGRYTCKLHTHATGRNTSGCCQACSGCIMVLRVAECEISRNLSRSNPLISYVNPRNDEFYYCWTSRCLISSENKKRGA